MSKRPSLLISCAALGWLALAWPTAGAGEREPASLSRERVRKLRSRAASGERQAGLWAAFSKSFAPAPGTVVLAGEDGVPRAVGSLRAEKENAWVLAASGKLPEHHLIFNPKGKLGPLGLDDFSRQSGGLADEPWRPGAYRALRDARIPLAVTEDPRSQSFLWVESLRFLLAGKVPPLTEWSFDRSPSHAGLVNYVRLLLPLGLVEQVVPERGVARGFRAAGQSMPPGLSEIVLISPNRGELVHLREIRGFEAKDGASPRLDADVGISGERRISVGAGALPALAVTNGTLPSAYALEVAATARSLGLKLRLIGEIGPERQATGEAGALESRSEFDELRWVFETKGHRVSLLELLYRDKLFHEPLDQLLEKLAAGEIDETVSLPHGLLPVEGERPVPTLVGRPGAKLPPLLAADELFEKAQLLVPTDPGLPAWSQAVRKAFESTGRWRSAAARAAADERARMDAQESARGKVAANPAAGIGSGFLDLRETLSGLFGESEGKGMFSWLLSRKPQVPEPRQLAASLARARKTLAEGIAQLDLSRTELGANIRRARAMIPVIQKAQLLIAQAEALLAPLRLAAAARHAELSGPEAADFARAVLLPLAEEVSSLDQLRAQNQVFMHGLAFAQEQAIQSLPGIRRLEDAGAIALEWADTSHRDLLALLEVDAAARAYPEALLAKLKEGQALLGDGAPERSLP